MPGSLFFTNKQKITLEKILVQFEKETEYRFYNSEFGKKQSILIANKIKVINKVLRHVKLNDRCN